MIQSTVLLTSVVLGYVVNKIIGILAGKIRQNGTDK